MNMARLVVEMDDDLHGRLKAVASLKRKTLKEMVIAWAEEQVEAIEDVVTPPISEKTRETTASGEIKRK